MDVATQIVDSKAAATSMDIGTNTQPTHVGESNKPKWGREKKTAPREPINGTLELVYMLDEAL